VERRIDYAEVLDERTKILILVAVFSGLFLTSLDQTIVSAALPKILADLGDLDLLAWTSTAYLLVSTAALPIFGKLSDLYGRKGILVFGMVVFLVGSALCGLAPTMLALVVSRGLQGLGAGGIASVALTIPADLYPPAERARLQGWLASVFAVSGIVGPFLGGFLTDSFGWHWIFFINLPFGLPALLFALAAMPTLESGRTERAIDFAGAGLLLVTVVPLLVACSLDPERFQDGLQVVPLLLAVSAVGLVIFLVVEGRAREPLLPLRLFRIPVFTLMCAISALAGGCFISALLFLPIFLVNVLGTSATEAGLAIMPETIGFLITAVVSGQIVQRTGRYKGVLLAGLLLLCVAYGGLATLSPATQLPQIWLWMTILGLGIGATFPQVNLALQNAVPYADVGTATSGRLFFVQLSQTAAGAIFGGVLTTLVTASLVGGLAPITADLPGASARYLDTRVLRNGGEAAANALVAFERTLPPPQRVAVVGEVREVLHRAFADAVVRLYTYAVPLVVVATLLGLVVPELPLRRSNTQEGASLAGETG